MFALSPTDDDLLTERRMPSVAASWVISCGMHALLVALLAWGWRATPVGAAREAVREVGIVLAPSESSSAQTQSADDANEPENAATTLGAAGVPDIYDVAPPADPTNVLPTEQDWLGIGAAAGGVTTGAGELGQGPQGRVGKPSPGATSTSVYGLVGQGHKFVYVFDRSGSMGGSGRSALNAAKEELLASLSRLGSEHEFQIIFYNDEPQVFTVPGQRWKLTFADDATKAAAERFVRQVRADGATNHERALSLAMKLDADVIFFLTDADQPIMSTAQLARIARLNSGATAIHAIEFGFGPALPGRNFLMDLAEQNGGRHRYVDVAQLGVTR